MEDVRARRGAYATSDHHLLLGKFRLRLKRHHKAKNQRTLYNTQHLINAQVGKTFKVVLSRENKELQQRRTINEECEY